MTILVPVGTFDMHFLLVNKVKKNHEEMKAVHIANDKTSSFWNATGIAS